MWDELPDEIELEILDSNFDTFTHGKKATYAQGCHGPLCAYIDNEENKAQYRAKAAAEGRVVKEYRPRPRQYDPDFLQEIIEWHHMTRNAIGRRHSMRAFWNEFVKREEEPALVV